MAEARVSVNLKEFTCPVCWDLLNHPVSVPCGHSFCKSCISTHWDGEDLSRVYSCPMCKHSFSTRPILGRSIVLAEMVERLRNTQVFERTLAGPEDVECDVCIGHKYKAVRSCLDCLASYCEVHFNLHNELNLGKQHTVTETRYNMKDRICIWHYQQREYFCCTEKSCVCARCLEFRCRDHETISLRTKQYQQQVRIFFAPVIFIDMLNVCVHVQ